MAEEYEELEQRQKRMKDVEEQIEMLQRKNDMSAQMLARDSSIIYKWAYCCCCC